jgi:hypothetical protein
LLWIHHLFARSTRNLAADLSWENWSGTRVTVALSVPQSAPFFVGCVDLSASVSRTMNSGFALARHRFPRNSSGTHHLNPFQMSKSIINTFCLSARVDSFFANNRAAYFQNEERKKIFVGY